MAPSPSVLSVMLGLLTVIVGIYLMGAGLYGLVRARLKVWPLGEVIGRGRFGWITVAGFLLMWAPAITTKVSFLAALVGLVAYVVTWIGVYGLITGRLGSQSSRKQIVGVVVAGLVLGGVSSAIEGSNSAVVAYKKAQEQEQAAAKQAREREAAAKKAADEEARKAAETEAKYQDALKLAESGDCTKAGTTLAILGDYKEAKKWYFECAYRLGKEAVSAKDWVSAATLLEVVPDDFKPDVKALKSSAHSEAVRVYWDLAQQAKAVKEYDAALTHLNQLKILGEKNADAEIAAVQKLKADAEAAARAEAERIATEAGDKPTNSAWDGAVFEVEQFLKRNLKDPKSFEAIDWYKPALGSYSGKYAWKVRVRYRAKNSFGGYVISDQMFYIRHGQVVFYEEL